MYSAAQVDNEISNWKTMGLTKAELAVKIAEACLGWPYVWGSYGQEDTVETRRTYMNRSVIGEGDRELIRKRCQVLNGSRTSCDGCKYYPGGAHTRMFDCRGFTRWVLSKVGISLSGAGATSQWNDNSNWSEKGEIKDMPLNSVCCVFKRVGTSTMDHTGLHIGGKNIIHCSGEVMRGKTTDRGWTHYAIPKGIGGDVPVPTGKPTLRRGSKGEDVRTLQEELERLGYGVGASGADGIFGKATEAAVKNFQRDHGLTADGIVGEKTYAELDKANKEDGNPSEEPLVGEYTVTISGLTQAQTEYLKEMYPGAIVSVG